MVFKANIGCCCCCKKTTIPFIKSFTLMGIVLSSVKILAYLVMMKLNSGPLRGALFFGFVFNVCILTISSVLRCKLKNPNFHKMKKLSIALTVLLCIEIFITFIGIIMVGFSLATTEYYVQYNDVRVDDVEETPDKGDVYYKRRNHDETIEDRGTMENRKFDDYDNERGYFRLGNFCSDLSSLVSLFVAFGLLIWQIYASCWMIKCAKYELNNQIQEETESSETSDEEAQPPKKISKKKKRREKKGFKNTQNIEFVEKPKKSRKNQNQQKKYVEFEDIQEVPSRPKTNPNARKPPVQNESEVFV